MALSLRIIQIQNLREFMGKGDKRSAKGKRVVGSYGNSRPKTKKVVAAAKKKTK